MQRVLVVCGAGASSSFLVHWLRREATARADDIRFDAGSIDDIDTALEDVDVLLVGHHLAAVYPALEDSAVRAGVASALLEPVGFDSAGARTAYAALGPLLDRGLVRGASSPASPSGETHA
ncbi:PTS sugar transporter subunit IIB [Marisediminicola sp. LYQ85]|uniref:PTS sugar transporter subunit IIB n=1 Tax=Marisediminicola sp. LYQ85 TaxID=3391062 RepID=UPI003983C101